MKANNFIKIVLSCTVLTLGLALQGFAQAAAAPVATAPAATAPAAPAQNAGASQDLPFQGTNTTIVKDPQGYKLKVDGKDFELKGVVWDYTPVGENYNYSLWKEDPSFIRSILDRDAEKMSAMGVTVIRTFSAMPPQWIEYLYNRWGIYSVVNPFFGRYGINVRGIWNPATDYSDRYTREKIKNETLAAVKMYKDTPGVLLFLFGNENNYGLEWQGTEIQNIPSGERAAVKAGYLYSLYEETISEAKQLDSHHPYGIVNGDTQYFDIIKQLLKSADFIGVNSYRGASFGDVFSRAKDLGLPIIFTEMGADAYNAMLHTEDQAHQQEIILAQWREIYQNSYGKGQAISLGGFTFSWTDGWWKYHQGDAAEARVHNTEASWANGAYYADFSPGKNNMNEEWFGIMGLIPGEKMEALEVRAIYTSLGNLWKTSLYASNIDAVVQLANSNVVTAQANGDLAKAGLAEQRANIFTIDTFNLSIIGSGVVQSEQAKSLADANTDPRQAITTNHTESADIGFVLNPVENLYGYADISFTNNYGSSAFGKSSSSLFSSPISTEYQDGVARLNRAAIRYNSYYFTINGFYRTIHVGWANEGDFFTLVPDITDIKSYTQSPLAMEFIGKDFLEGFAVYGGPQIFADAKPQVAAKYWRNFNVGSLNTGFSAIYIEEFPPLSKTNPFSMTAALPTLNRLTEPTRKASLWYYGEFQPYVRFELGVLDSGSENVGRAYTYAESTDSGKGLYGSSTNLKTANITWLDTLAYKVKLSTNILSYTSLFVEGIYAGAVADGGPAQGTWSGVLTGDPGYGNRIQGTVGGTFIYDSLAVTAFGRYRRALYNALPLNIGITRDQTVDPFTVTPANRDTLEGNLAIVFDPTGGTYFYNWDADNVENADFAAGISTNYQFYAGPTDPAIGYQADGVTTFNFVQGLPAQYGLWNGQFKIFANPGYGIHIVAEYHAGLKGSTGMLSSTNLYMGGYLKGWFDSFIVKAFLEKDNYGGTDGYYQQFQITYPWQWAIDIGYALDGRPNLISPSSVAGVRVTTRMFDDTHTQQAGDPTKGYMTEVQLYVNLSLDRYVYKKQ